jgi:large subunit ribosomal protein L15
MLGLNDIKDNRGSRHAYKRVGRGIGSGKGKTAGRGAKGQKSRSGVSIRWFEGGQSPIYRRLPKRGFNNADFKKVYAIVNLSTIQALVDAKLVKDFVDAKILRELNVIGKAGDGLKVLAKGELKSAVSVEAAVFSAGAKAAIEKAGGKAVSTAAPKAEKGKRKKFERAAPKLARAEKKKAAKGAEAKASGAGAKAAAKTKAEPKPAAAKAKKPAAKRKPA